MKFTLRKGHCPTVNINQTIIFQTEAVKYRTALRLQVKLGRTHRPPKKIDLKTEQKQLIDREKKSIYL
jgi:hypothetical protein